MNKTITLIILLILSFSTLLAQKKTERRLDSLIKVSKKQDDIILIKTLNEIAWEYKNIDVDSSLIFAKKAITISSKISNNKALASAYNSLANVFEAKGNLDSALVYHSQSLNIKLSIKDTLGIADSYNNIGIINDEKGNYSTSLENYFKALDIYEKYSVDLSKTPMVLGNIGIVYKRQKEYKKALKYYNEALKIYEDTNYEIGIVINKGNIGGLLLKLAEYKESIKYSKDAKELYKKLGYTRYVPYSVINMAIAYDSLKQHKIARQLYISAIKDFERDQNTFELIHSKIGLAKNYNTTKESLKAKKTLLEVLKNLEGKEFKEWEISAYKQLSETEYLLKNYKNAYSYAKKYAIGKDSLYEKEKTKTIFELDSKYQTEKKEKEIIIQKEELLQQKLELKNKKLYTILLGFGLLFSALIGYGLYRRKQQLTREISLKDALASAVTQNRLQEQRLSISRDLHDNIGSQLTFIISSIENLKFAIKSSDEVVKSKLSDITNFATATIFQLRDTIWAMNKNEISFSDFESRILTFIEKAKIAKSDIQFNFKNNIKSDAVYSSIKGINIFRVIQEAVNNAIKYADASQIDIEITEFQNSYTIRVLDNGKGFDLKTTTLSNGIENMQKRMKEIGATLKIDSVINKGTSIEITTNK